MNCSHESDKEKSPKRTLLKIVLALLLAGIAVAVFVHRPEPAYGGKSISAWFEKIQGNTKNWGLENEDVYQAFCAIGSNAVPFLKEKLSAKRPAAAKYYSQTVKVFPTAMRRKLPRVYGDYYYEQERADAARLLGRIPSYQQKTNLLTPADFYGSQWPEVLQALKMALTDSSPEVRTAAAEAIWTMHSAAYVLIPDLISATADSNRDVKWETLSALTRFGSLASNAIPCLCNVATNQEFDSGIRGVALEGLANMGNTATGAAPVIAQLLSSDEAKIREDAASTLAKIGSTPDSAKQALQILLQSNSIRAQDAAMVALWNSEPENQAYQARIVSELKSNADPRRTFILDFLGARGSNAAVFLPEIRLILNDDSDFWRIWATNTVQKISGSKL